MNMPTLYTKYTRLAALALFVSLCGQTVRASEIHPALPTFGAAFAGVSAVVRLLTPGLSQPGLRAYTKIK